MLPFPTLLFRSTFTLQVWNTNLYTRPLSTFLFPPPSLFDVVRKGVWRRRRQRRGPNKLWIWVYYCMHDLFFFFFSSFSFFFFPLAPLYSIICIFVSLNYGNSHGALTYVFLAATLIRRKLYKFEFCFSNTQDRSYTNIAKSIWQLKY